MDKVVLPKGPKNFLIILDWWVQYWHLVKPLQFAWERLQTDLPCSLCSLVHRSTQDRGLLVPLESRMKSARYSECLWASLNPDSGFDGGRPAGGRPRGHKWVQRPGKVRTECFTAVSTVLNHSAPPPPASLLTTLWFHRWCILKRCF